MQPYFLPYIGYFQLLAAVDRFVIYDDVTYIKGGWIARNNLLSPVGPQRFFVQLKGRSSNQRICDLAVIDEFGKLRRAIEQNYRRAPYYADVINLLGTILQYPDLALGSFLTHSLEVLKEYLGLPTKMIRSSQLQTTPNCTGPQRVIAICQQLNADHYINLPGGQSLYRTSDFERSGMKLSFIKSRPVHYRQFGNTFTPNLSMLDVLMFNSVEQCQYLLAQYDLVCPVGPEATNELISHG